MIGLIAVIGVVLMISLMSSPFMSGLEGFQEGAAPRSSDACAAAKEKCDATNTAVVKKMNENRSKWITGTALKNSELAKAENSKEKATMAISACKSLFVNNCR